MTANATWTIFCDADDGSDNGCHHWADADAVGASDSAAKARSSARAMGWTRLMVERRYIDLCPHHARQEAPR